MVNKGGFSFVAMLVINPVVILFYQNCSMAPVSYAARTAPPAVERHIASVPTEQPIKIAKPSKVCEHGKADCLKTIE